MNRALAGKIAAVSTAGVLGIGGVAIATSGSGAASASDTSATPTASSTAAPAHPKAAKAAKAHKDARLAVARRVVHGDFTAKTKDGYQQFDAQRGEVTALTSSSLTVKSADGFTSQYAVNSSTIVRVGKDKVAIGSVKVGDTAIVVAKDASGSKTATRVLARAK